MSEPKRYAITFTAESDGPFVLYDDIKEALELQRLVDKCKDYEYVTFETYDDMVMAEMYKTNCVEVRGYGKTIPEALKDAFDKEDG